MPENPMISSYVVWIIFVFVQVIYWWSRAALAIRSTLPNGVRTLTDWVRREGPVLALRFIIASAIFWWWFNDPTLANKFFDAVAKHLPAGFWTMFVSSITFPLNPGTAALYSLAIDGLLDKGIALLSRVVPQLGRDVPPIAHGDEEAKG